MEEAETTGGETITTDVEVATADATITAVTDGGTTATVIAGIMTVIVTVIIATVIREIPTVAAAEVGAMITAGAVEGGMIATEVVVEGIEEEEMIIAAAVVAGMEGGMIDMTGTGEVMEVVGADMMTAAGEMIGEGEMTDMGAVGVPTDMEVEAVEVLTGMEAGAVEAPTDMEVVMIESEATTDQGEMIGMVVAVVGAAVTLEEEEVAAEITAVAAAEEAVAEISVVAAVDVAEDAVGDRRGHLQKRPSPISYPRLLLQTSDFTNMASMEAALGVKSLTPGGEKVNFSTLVSLTRGRVCSPEMEWMLKISRTSGVSYSLRDHSCLPPNVSHSLTNSHFL